MAGAILILVVLSMWASLAYTIYNRRKNMRTETAQSTQTQDERLHCQVDIVPSNDLRDPSDIFVIKIRGTIFAPTAMHEANIEVYIDDITEGTDKTLPVLCNIEHWQMDDSPAFYYRVNYGKIPQQRSTLTYWTPVVKPTLNMLSLPRTGQRKLQFSVSIISSETDDIMAQAAAAIVYNNPNSGYLNIEEGHRLTEALTIRLALAVNQKNQKTLDKAKKVIGDWIEIKTSQCPPEIARHLKERLMASLAEAMELCGDGEKLDINTVCERIRNTAMPADRLAAMELTLRAAAPSFMASIKEIKLLQEVRDQLEMDHDKFRLLCQKILPLKTRRSRNNIPEFILGITADMDDETIRKKLNDEYKRWNGRVNHPDTEIRDRVDFMLELIANARTKCAKPVAVTS